MTTAIEGEARSDAQASPLLLGVNDVARLLSVSVRTVRRLADGGAMPAPIRLRGSLRWDRRAIEAWIADGCPRDWRRRRAAQ